MLTILRDRRSYTVNITGHPPPPPTPLKFVRAHNTTSFYFLVILHVTQSVLFTTSEEIHACKHETLLKCVYATQQNVHINTRLSPTNEQNVFQGNSKIFAMKTAGLEETGWWCCVTAGWRMVWAKCDEVNQIMEKDVGWRKKCRTALSERGFPTPTGSEAHLHYKGFHK